MLYPSFARAAHKRLQEAGAQYYPMGSMDGPDDEPVACVDWNDAKAYADKHDIAYSVQQPKERIVRPKAYADNFAVSRKVPWSH